MYNVACGGIGDVLDLPAAFDVVNHEVLLGDCLEMSASTVGRIISHR